MIDSVKKSEDKKGYIIKMYNCSEQEQSCRINLKSGTAKSTVPL